MKHKADAPELWSKFDYESSAFTCANRNKRSLTVDLKKPQGLALAQKLAAKADVLTENVWKITS
jgi:crotonobetainyl-CoA:carnitine CoA-transferase CaiB-like acyl-CoA transferase